MKEELCTEQAECMKLTHGIDTILVICRPFLPDENTDIMNCNFCFMLPDAIDIVSVLELSKAYKLVFIEKILADRMKKELGEIREKIVIIDDCIENMAYTSEIRVAFLASSDTHVAFMVKIAEAIPNHIFLIPDRRCKDDAAAAALEREGKTFIEIHYKATECKELIDFHPQYIYTATDWTSEFIAVKKIIAGTTIKTIALQEGPEDWHMKFISNQQLKVLNHYRNADVFFSQGSRTMFFIRPKYFAITGSPKIDRIEYHPLPEKPKVLINCNFTYLSTKPPYERKRNIWMESVLRVCKEIGIDYIISKHPRDDSKWDDPNLINSSAYTIKQQLMECSISISRFSSIPFETLAQSRKAIYYNVHLEPMPTFIEDTEGEVMIITEEEELKKTLIEHINHYPYKFDKNKNELYLNRYVGMQDGKALERVTHTLQAIAVNRWMGNKELMNLLEGMKELPQAADKKTFAIYMMPVQQKNSEYITLTFAEALAASGHKVFILTGSYSTEYKKFFELEHHKDIEYVLTRDFEEMLELDHINYVVCVPGSRETEQYYINAVKLCQNNGAKILLFNNGHFAGSNIAEKFLKEYRDIVLEQRLQEIFNKDAGLKNMLEVTLQVQEVLYGK